MVTHTQNLCSALTHPKCTHTAVNTHTHTHTHTHREHTQSSGQPFMLWRPGSSWGFGSLHKGTSVMVLRVERERCTFTAPTYNTSWPETRTRNIWITSPDSLTIRPQLPYWCGSLISKKIYIKNLEYYSSTRIHIKKQ